MAAQLQAYARGTERNDRFANFVFRPSIRCGHFRVTRAAKERGGHTGPCQSHDQHALAPQFERIRHFSRKKNRLTRMLDYLNFSVVSANRANTSAAIQKRTITFDS